MSARDTQPAGGGLQERHAGAKAHAGGRGPRAAGLRAAGCRARRGRGSCSCGVVLGAAFSSSHGQVLTRDFTETGAASAFLESHGHVERYAGLNLLPELATATGPWSPSLHGHVLRAAGRAVPREELCGSSLSQGALRLWSGLQAIVV